MGQTARLCLIRDRFIAGHNSCELRRHLDSVPQETPIRDIVDWCRVWQSHADSDLRVAAVTTPHSMPDQVEDFFRRLLASAAAPAPTPKPEPLVVDQLLQRLMAEAQARQPVPAVATGSAGLEMLLRNLLSVNLAPVWQPQPGPIRGIGMRWCGSPVARRAIAPLAVPLWMNPSCSCYRDRRRRRSRAVML